MTRRRSRAPKGNPATSTTATVDSRQSNPEILVDLKITGGINADLWALLYDDRFRLALRCDDCGRWLTSHKSKAAGRGPTCSARAVR